MSFLLGAYRPEGGGITNGAGGVISRYARLFPIYIKAILLVVILYPFYVPVCFITGLSGNGGIGDFIQC